VKEIIFAFMVQLRKRGKLFLKSFLSGTICANVKHKYFFAYNENFMKKDSIICFRVSKELHKSLAQIAHADRRSLSSMIEMILSTYLTDKQTFPGLEMRRYPRKPVDIPTVISRQEFEQNGKGFIADISLGGVRILIPKDFAQNVTMNSKGSKFNIIFDLPREHDPVKITCESTRVVDDGDNIVVGASFVDAEFKSYKSLQTYLM